MKFTEYTPENTESGTRSTKPHVSFTKSGTVSLSVKATEILGAKVGDKISVIMEEPEKKNDEPQFYLVNNGDKGAGFALKAATNKLLIFSNAYMKNKINLALFPEVNGKGFRLLLAQEPTNFEGRKFFCLLKPRETK
jgi:hypothetical protein